MGNDVKIQCDARGTGSVTIDGTEVPGVHKAEVYIDVSRRHDPVEVHLTVRTKTLELSAEGAWVGIMEDAKG